MQQTIEPTDDGFGAWLTAQAQVQPQNPDHIVGTQSVGKAGVGYACPVWHYIASLGSTSHAVGSLCWVDGFGKVLDLPDGITKFIHLIDSQVKCEDDVTAWFALQMWHATVMHEWRTDADGLRVLRLKQS